MVSKTGFDHAIGVVVRSCEVVEEVSLFWEVAIGNLVADATSTSRVGDCGHDL